MAPGGSESVRNSGVRNPHFTIPMRFVAEQVMRERRHCQAGQEPACDFLGACGVDQAPGCRSVTLPTSGERKRCIQLEGDLP